MTHGEERRPLRIVFAGGGTGGHIYPALAIADEVRKLRPDVDILFIGTADRIEARVVPASGYRLETIWISAFKRRIRWSIILFPLKLIVSLIQSWRIMRRVRPNVVVGTGGYVSGPPVRVAAALNIPTVLQEQNSYPGVTTRLLADKASRVFLAFERSKSYLPVLPTVRVVGNPVRSSFGSITRDQGAAMFGLLPSLTTILVFGGSAGAESINAAMLGMVEKIAAMRVQVIWQTGSQESMRLLNAVRELRVGNMVKVMPYIDRIEYAFGACDMAICRAGATTLAELALAGVPAVLVPYPFAAADHQTHNAAAVAETGGAVVCKDSELSTELERLTVDLLQHPDKRAAMAERMRTLARPRASQDIAQDILRIAQA